MKTVRDYGFADPAEFNRMLAAVDVSRPEVYEAFRRWHATDQTKAGLLKLPGVADRVRGQLDIFDQHEAHT